MTLDLAQVVAGWPLGVSLAAALAAQGVQAGRRRNALNEALHELRRPLQTLALAPAGAATSSAIEGSVQMVATALERLEREINGDAPAPARGLVPVQPLLAAAVGRWRGRAALAGGSLDLGGVGGAVEGDRCELAQAVDNLIVNAIEHGGPQIRVYARERRDRLRIVVADSGRGSRSPGRQESPAELIARLLGRSRRGHGLRVVQRTVAAHAGDFRLRCCEQGTEAAIELPLAGRGG